MLFELNRAPRGAIASEARALIHLALPMMIAQVAQVGTGFVDTVMAGNVSTDDLAAVSLGSSVFITVYVTLMGVVAALNPILSHLLGAKAHARVGETGRQGLWFGLFIGVIGTLLMFASMPLLRAWLDLPAHVEDMTVLYVAGAALGMPAAMMHRSLHAYASSLGHPRPIMLVSLAALALNIPLNYLLIHGLFGLPKLGGAGCGWATALVFWFNALALFAYIAKTPALQKYALTARFSRPDFARFGEFLKLGVPIGMSFFVEVSLFSFIALLVAQLGTLVVAGHQAVLNFTTIIYMLPQSLSVALTVRVGHAVGAGDYLKARFASGVGLVTGLVASAVTMVAVLLLREPIIRMYTNDPQVVALGLTLLWFAAAYQLTDAVQTVASGALRGYKLTRVPLAIHLFSFWVLGLGLGYVLALTDYLVPAMGVTGFWAALVISLSAAALFLVYYLARESRKRLARQVSVKAAA